MKNELNERQFQMLNDISRFNFKKYRYQAMPPEEVAIRDWRSLNALLRRELIEFPMTRNHLGFPDMDDKGLRITQKGIDYLKAV